MHIYQLTPNITTGDGVSQGVMFIADLLTQLGVPNTTLAQVIHPELTHRVSQPHDVAPTSQDILLYHHSVGLEPALAAWLHQFPGRRLMIYHNITPASFFPVGSPHHHACTLGREQLASWQGLFLASLADSDYNRQELDNLGYANTRTLPLLFNLQQLYQRASQPVPPRAHNAFNLLFVGRIAPNKCQHQLIDLLPYLQQRTDMPLHLTLVGGVSTPEYQQYLHQRIHAQQLDAHVTLHGKVNDQLLHQCYAQADLFLSLSEHEGFGIPLIEAMAYDLPVAAYPAGAIASTLGGAGKLLPIKHLPTLADAIVSLIHDPWQRHHIIQRQRQRLHSLHPQQLLADLVHWLQQQGVLSASAVPSLHTTQSNVLDSPAPHWQIQGPYDSSYSLALVNRELARALHALGQPVSLYSTEGPGDYAANQSWLQQQAPDLIAHQASAAPHRPNSIALRNLYPPRLTDTHTDFTVLGSYGWEESSFPAELVQQLNARAHLVATMSHYVADTLVNNGVSAPMAVTGLGADHILRQPAQPIAGLTLHPQGPVFLHISSAFPRKGLDILIDAFTRAFAPWQPAQLVIKTFANPHNQLASWLQQAGWHNQTPGASIQSWRRNHNDACHISVIWQELDNPQLRWLYENTTALVAPTRGEGFGLPQAEAMFCRLPVITTALGGQTDFCTPDTAWLIPATPQPADTHLQQINSLWFEPDTSTLIQLLHQFSQPDPQRQTKIHAAWQQVQQHCTWRGSAQRLIHALAQARNSTPAPQPHLALVTTWNQRCGIATYSRFLTTRFPSGQWSVFAPVDAQLTQPDEPNVHRCWHTGQADPLTNLMQALDTQGITHVLIQFNFSFFRLSALADLITHLCSRGITPVITLHASADVPPQHGAKSLREIRETLTQARLLVHSPTDIQRLHAWGIPAHLFPHGIISPPQRPVTTTLDPLIRHWQAQHAPIIASYGFLLPHKGIPELITAFEQLKSQHPTLKLLLLNAQYPAPVSQALAHDCAQRIQHSPHASDICLHTHYTHDHEALSLLARATLLVMPYQNTQESSSAAVRFALASGRPVLVTPLDIFRDVHDQVIPLPGTTPSQLAQGIHQQLISPQHTPAHRQRWLAAHQWPTLSERLWHSITRSPFIQV